VYEATVGWACDYERSVKDAYTVVMKGSLEESPFGRKG
jgi:hypothetical protein